MTDINKIAIKRTFKIPRTVKTSYEKLGKKTQKTYSNRVCINMHNSTKYAICMHKINKTLEKGYKYTRPTFHYTHSFKLI